MVCSRTNYYYMRKKFSDDYIVIFEEEGKKNYYRTFFDSAVFLRDNLSIKTYGAEGGIGATFFRSQLPDDITLWYIGEESNCYGIQKSDLLEENEPDCSDDLDNEEVEEDEEIEEDNELSVNCFLPPQEIVKSCYNCRNQYIEERCPHLMRPHVCEDWNYKPEVDRAAYDERNRQRNKAGRQTNPGEWDTNHYRPE